MSVSDAPSEGEEPRYKMTISLNVLNHLGIGLYSNIPAVLSEIVANAWDADATKVSIDISSEKGEIVILDNGSGMTRADINQKYLNVGYQKRVKEPGRTAEHDRHPMGRKGIGKLSVFSVAKTVEIYSVKHGQQNALCMNSDDIKAKIEGTEDLDYFPDVIEDLSPIDFTKGTKIILRDLRKSVKTTEGFLRRRLARRFSIIGAEYKFRVAINGADVTLKDRAYYDKIEFLWYLGEIAPGFYEDEGIGTLRKNVRKTFSEAEIVDSEAGYRATGWIGTVDEQKNIDEENNTIVVLAHGKLIQEDLLQDLKEGGVYSKYLIGEIDADFMDLDDDDDIVTSDRQSVKEDDPRYQELRSFVQAILKRIQNQWTELRTEIGEERALAEPIIKRLV